MASFGFKTGVGDGYLNKKILCSILVEVSDRFLVGNCHMDLG